MYKISDYPHLQNNFFLGGRGAGASKKFVGDVNILTVFLKRELSDWSENTKTKYYAAVNKAADFLMSEAAKYGAYLNIHCFHLETAVPKDANPKAGYALVKNYFHRESINEIQTYYEKSMGVDEVPIILAFNGPGRSFAYKENSNDMYTAQELSVIFFENNDNIESKKISIAHELLHQFGAIDYYFPKELKTIAEKYIGNSIMGVGQPWVDDLTAYLIGWKDTISANSYWFLKETMWMDEKRMEEEKRKAWKE